VAAVLVLARPGDAPDDAMLAAARRLGTPVAVLCGEPGAQDAQRYRRRGVPRLLAAPGPQPGQYGGVREAEALVAAARRERPAAVLIAAGRDGQEIAARVAVRLDAGIVTDAVDLYRGPEGVVAVREAFDGTHLVASTVRRGPAVITVRAGAVSDDGAVPDDAAALDEAVSAADACAVVCLKVKSSSAAYGARLVSRTPKPADTRPELRAAPVVVAGGRGVGSAGGFDLLGLVARALGAAVGGSRAAADLGWCPPGARIDQTGASVHPRLYLACGISGSVRHRAGMQRARTIVAIDRDPAAPIFRYADFGVIGDLGKVLPALLAEIARRRRSGTGADDLMEA